MAKTRIVFSGLEHVRCPNCSYRVPVGALSYEQTVKEYGLTKRDRQIVKAATKKAKRSPPQNYEDQK